MPFISFSFPTVLTQTFQHVLYQLVWAKLCWSKKQTKNQPKSQWLKEQMFIIYPSVPIIWLRCSVGLRQSKVASLCFCDCQGRPKGAQLNTQWSFKKNCYFLVWASDHTWGFNSLCFYSTGFLLLCRLSSLCSKRGLLSSCLWASHCGGFSCYWAWALGCVGFSSCGSRAQ